jgi:predicted enzyme related to lactoylglutathione lyase
VEWADRVLDHFDGESQPGINGGLMARRDPAQPCVNTMDVVDLDATVAAIEAAGGLCVVPKMPIPGVGLASLLQGYRRPHLWSDAG